MWGRTALGAHEKVRPLLSGDRTGSGWFESELERCQGLGLPLRLPQLLLVLLQPILQDRDRRQEVVSLRHQQVDVVEVLSTAKTVRQIVPRIDRRAKFAAGRTLKAEVPIDMLPELAATKLSAAAEHAFWQWKFANRQKSRAADLIDWIRQLNPSAVVLLTRWSKSFSGPSGLIAAAVCLRVLASVVQSDKNVQECWTG